MSQFDPFSSAGYRFQLPAEAFSNQVFGSSLTNAISSNPQDDISQFRDSEGSLITVYQKNQYNPANQVVITLPISSWNQPESPLIPLPAPIPVPAPITVIPSNPCDSPISGIPEPWTGGILGIMLLMFMIWRKLKLVF